MTIEIRGITPEENDAFSLPVHRGFLATRVEDHTGPQSDVERSFAALDGDEFVGGCGSYDFHMTLPGGDRVRVGGLTGVAVQATHRRRGALRGLMDAHLDDCRQQGEAASVLMASQSNIYRRFGYGVATQTAGWRIDSTGGRYEQPADTGGSLRFMLQEDAAATLAAIYPGAMADRAGALDRPGEWFDGVLARKAGWMGGGDVFVVVHTDSEGVDDGYVVYRIATSGPPGAEIGSVDIIELIAGDPLVEAALWRFCLDIDLVDEVTYLWGPVDPTVAWWLVEPRRLEATRLQDFLWVRPLDVVALLGRRSYRTDGRIVVGVDDPDDSEVHGRWSIEVSDETAQVERTDGPAGVTMSAASLGAVCLGGQSVDGLARVGRVAGDPGAVAGADLIMGTARPPWCITKF
jgi:predicted acetyltransferase